MRQVAGIIIAAGSSTRFGSNKLLASLPYGNSDLPMIALTITTWLKVFSTVTVVVRSMADSEAYSKALNELADQVHWVVCEKSKHGMGASIAGGVASISADAWLIGLADMPFVLAESIQQIKSRMEEGAMIAALYVNGERGHPVGFSSGYAAELQSLDADIGARVILKRDEAMIEKVVVSDVGTIFDIDHPEDIKQFHIQFDKERAEI